MQPLFSNALSKAVENHIKLSDTRRETLAWLALLIMQQGTICLWRLAAYVASPAQTDSVRRRFYRFFQHVKLDGAAAACVVADLLGLGGKPWVLTVDRKRFPQPTPVPKTPTQLIEISGTLKESLVRLARANGCRV